MAPGPLLLAAVILASCGGSVAEPSPSATQPPRSLGPGEYPLPTYLTTLNGIPVACGGVSYSQPVTIHGSASDPALAWILFAHDGHRESLLWPAGYSAHFAPSLEVINAYGSVVAREGELATGGCPMPPGGTLIVLPTVRVGPSVSP